MAVKFSVEKFGLSAFKQIFALPAVISYRESPGDGGVSVLTVLKLWQSRYYLHVRMGGPHKGKKPPGCH